MKLIAAFTSPEELHRAMRERADVVAMSRQTLDELAGLASGHSAMLLCTPPQKGFGLMSMFSMAGALGGTIAIIEDPRAMEKMLRYPKRDERRVQRGKHWRNAKAVSIMREMAKKNGKLGVAARMTKLSPKRRSQIARKAAKARWRKPTIVEVKPRTLLGSEK